MSTEPPITSTWRIPRILKYALVGVSNTTIDFGVFSLLYLSVGIDPIWSNLCAFGIAVSHSYLFNAGWTFRQSCQRLSLRDYLTFIVINIGCLLFSTACILLLSGAVPPVIAKLVAAVIVLFWGFFLSQQFVFKGAIQNSLDTGRPTNRNSGTRSL